jgi:hypothetical protein
VAAYLACMALYAGVLAELEPPKPKHKDGKGFNVMLQAFPLDGKIVCSEMCPDVPAVEGLAAERQEKDYRGGC